VFRKVPPPTLSRNLLFRTLAYRLQADRFGDLDAESRRILENVKLDGRSDTLKGVIAGFRRPDWKLQPGTVLSREWKGKMHRVTITAMDSAGTADLQEPDPDRLRHHWHPLERPPVLRLPEQVGSGGGVLML
jgi:hypothetical protein